MKLNGCLMEENDAAHSYVQREYDKKIQALDSGYKSQKDKRERE